LLPFRPIIRFADQFEVEVNYEVTPNLDLARRSLLKSTRKRTVEPSSLQPVSPSQPLLHIGPIPKGRFPELGDRLREFRVSSSPVVDCLGSRKAHAFGDRRGIHQ
jgi:hypothetical protein